MCGSPDFGTHEEGTLRMAIRIKARQNESVGQMLRRFKKLCDKEGLTKDIKKRQYYEKPSERRCRAQRKAISRLARIAAGPQERGGHPAAHEQGHQRDAVVWRRREGDDGDTPQTGEQNGRV